MQIRTATTAQTPEELLNDLRTMVRHAERMLNPSPEEIASETLAALGSRYDAMQKGLGDFYLSTKTKITVGAKCTDAAIRAHPYQSLALALGAGLLIGTLVGRQSK
jgi:ElaB/YqjD/DUF883 family membrane-anchored ribosome-binding protein